MCWCPCNGLKPLIYVPAQALGAGRLFLKARPVAHISTHCSHHHHRRVHSDIPFGFTSSHKQTFPLFRLTCRLSSHWVATSNFRSLTLAVTVAPPTPTLSLFLHLLAIGLGFGALEQHRVDVGNCMATPRLSMLWSFEKKRRK